MSTRASEDRETLQTANGWRAWTKILSPAEWLRLAGFGSVITFLHIAGWGLFIYYSRHNPALAGLGTLAYTFEIGRAHV